jgi:hypothetical protein
MKKIVIVCMLLAGSGIANAQNGASQTNWQDNSQNTARGAVQHDNEFANTEINVDNRKVIFSELPDVKKATWAIVTDPAGTVMTQKRVNPTDNTMDLHRLPKGEMYFLTLVYKNKSQKAFVLHF